MTNQDSLRLKDLKIDTQKESRIYLHKDSDICVSEGFVAKNRLLVELNGQKIIASLIIVESDILAVNEACLSKYAWNYLNAKEGDFINVQHAKHLYSLKYLRHKIYGNELNYQQIKSIIKDITHGYYSNIDISAFLTAFSTKVSKDEIIHLTKAMVDVGDRIIWPKNDIIVDKHCIGGLPGNRTTPIVVAIIAACGIKIPKTSSRAITSACGTADMMEVLTNVDANLENIKKIVGKESGCLIWGGSLALSPADDIIINIERSLDIDSESQLIASILSKKIAAGATHILIDIPVGKTAKVRSKKAAIHLKNILEEIGKVLEVEVKAIISDGNQPIGNGIGPALEARDVLRVLNNDVLAAQDLIEKSLLLAANILEFLPDIKKGQGLKIAEDILKSGQALEKFQNICQAQGKLKQIKKAKFKKYYKANISGVIKEIDNRQISLIAKLAGAPNAKEAGIDLLVKIGDKVKAGDILFEIQANSQGTLKYALENIDKREEIIKIL